MVSPLDNSALSGLGLNVPTAAPRQDLGQADFLHLMVTQLKNQDPFKPLESGEFLGQLAQFGTVNGLAGLQTSFDGLATSLVSNQALQASTLVGRSALVETSTLRVAAGQNVTGAVELPAVTSGATVTIRDATGQPVRTLNLGAQLDGLAAFTWDGLDDTGNPVAAGRYAFGASYHTSTGSVAADTLLRAPIDSVLLGADGFSVELRGIGELPFTAVREIRNDAAGGTPAAAAGASAAATP
jgi:flagellar basal-body rod modification protein FlgD